MDERFGRRYEDDDRRFTESAPREYEGRRYRGEGYYGGYYQPARSGGAYERRDRPDDRGLLDRAGDELRSWFGDEEAERRRRADEREARRRGGQAQRWGEGRGWGGPDSRERERRDADYRERGEADYVDERTWARQWGYVEHPSERGATFGGPPRDERWGAGYGRGATMREDWMTRGPFSGRGPKGYERSDERIREDVCDLLCEHGAVDASNVEVRVQGREVTLAGFVPSRLQKRLAEDLADSVSGVHEVHNQLRVSPTATTTQPGQPGEAGPTDWRDRAA